MRALVVKKCSPQPVPTRRGMQKEVLTGITAVPRSGCKPTTLFGFRL